MEKQKLATAPAGKGRGCKFVAFTCIEDSLLHQLKGEV